MPKIPTFDYTLTMDTEGDKKMKQAARHVSEALKHITTAFTTLGGVKDIEVITKRLKTIREDVHHVKTWLEPPATDELLGLGATDKLP